MTSVSEPKLSEELAAIAAEHPRPGCHIWESDCGRHYAVISVRNYSITVYALDPTVLSREIAEAEHDMAVALRDEYPAQAAA